jgi:flagellar biosynthesis protein FlhG
MYMKGIEEQTYYEILEVSPSANAKEIQKAYEHAKETFHTDSPAVYSLFTEQEIHEIQIAIEEAYRVLMDGALRKSYDQSHDQVPGRQRWKKPPEAQIVAHEKKTSSPGISISIHTEEGLYHGKMLKQIREKMGIDLETVAQETKINIKTLELIENEDLNRLPALVYLKGFLRGYAQSLGLNPQKVVDGYLEFVEESKKK